MDNFGKIQKRTYMLPLAVRVLVWHGVSAERVGQGLHGVFDGGEWLELPDHDGALGIAEFRSGNNSVWNGDQHDVHEFQEQSLVWAVFSRNLGPALVGTKPRTSFPSLW